MTDTPENTPETVDVAPIVGNPAVEAPPAVETPVVEAPVVEQPKPAKQRVNVRRTKAQEDEARAAAVSPDGLPDGEEVEARDEGTFNVRVVGGTEIATRIA